MLAALVGALPRLETSLHSSTWVTRTWHWMICRSVKKSILRMFKTHLYQIIVLASSCCKCCSACALENVNSKEFKSETAVIDGFYVNGDECLSNCIGTELTLDAMFAGSRFQSCCASRPPRVVTTSSACSSMWTVPRRARSPSSTLLPIPSLQPRLRPS